MSDNNPPRHPIVFGETVIVGAKHTSSVTRVAGQISVLFDRLGAAAWRDQPSASHAVEIVIPIIEAAWNAAVIIDMRGHGGTYSDGAALLVAHDGNLDQTVRFDEPRDFHTCWACPVFAGQRLRLSLLVAARQGDQANSDALVQVDSIDITAAQSPSGTMSKPLPTAERMKKLR